MFFTAPKSTVIREAVKKGVEKKVEKAFLKEAMDNRVEITSSNAGKLVVDSVNEAGERRSVSSNAQMF